MVSVLHTGIVSRKSFSAVRRKSMMVYTRFRCQIAAGDDDAPTSDGLDPSVISQGNVKGPASPRSPAQVGTPSSSAVLPQPHCLLAYTMHHINHTAYRQSVRVHLHVEHACGQCRTCQSISYQHRIIHHAYRQCVFGCTLSTHTCGPVPYVLNHIMPGQGNLYTVEKTENWSISVSQ